MALSSDSDNDSDSDNTRDFYPTGYEPGASAGGWGTAPPPPPLEAVAAAAPVQGANPPPAVASATPPLSPPDECWLGDEGEDLGRILPDHDRYSYSDVAAVADGRLWIICWRRIPQPGSPYAGRSFLARYDAASNTFLEGAEILGDSGGQTGELGNAAAVAAI